MIGDVRVKVETRCQNMRMHVINQENGPLMGDLSTCSGCYSSVITEVDVPYREPTKWVDDRNPVLSLSKEST